MFLNAKQCIEQGWLVGDIADECIQPNALDFTIDELYSIQDINPALLTSDDSPDTTRRMVLEQISDLREHYHMFGQPTPSISDRRVNGWCLGPKKQYIGRSSIKLNLPKNAYGVLMPRSSFNRNGVFITSHVHTINDEYIEFLIVNNGYTCIEAGTRIGQILITTCEEDVASVSTKEIKKPEPIIEEVIVKEEVTEEVTTKEEVVEELVKQPTPKKK